MSDSGTTVGIWIDEGSDLIERFDRTMNTGEGTYSRSKSIKEAMELAIDIEMTLRRLGYDDMSPRDRRAWIKQSMLDQDRRDRLEE